MSYLGRHNVESSHAIHSMHSWDAGLYALPDKGPSECLANWDLLTSKSRALVNVSDSW